MVCVSSGVLCAFANLYLQGSNVFMEGISVAHSGVVYSRISREVHRAVSDGLLWQVAAAALDGERGFVCAVVVRRFDGEALRPGTLPYRHGEDQQRHRKNAVFVTTILLIIIFVKIVNAIKHVEAQQCHYDQSDDLKGCHDLFVFLIIFDDKFPNQMTKTFYATEKSFYSG